MVQSKSSNAGKERNGHDSAGRVGSVYTSLQRQPVFSFRASWKSNEASGTGHQGPLTPHRLGHGVVHSASRVHSKAQSHAPPGETLTQKALGTPAGDTPEGEETSQG
ncbi:hypothetical protein MRX96_008305 [Rhipicephalus microplus]